MFPKRRMRRLRSGIIRPLLSETALRKLDLVAPVFFDETTRERKGIPSMPGQFRYPLAEAAEVAGDLWDAGIRAVLLFGIPAVKDRNASSAFAQDGVVQRAVRAIKDAVPGILVATDVCACEYTDHGHCGIVGEGRHGPDLLNDASLELMNRIALSHAESGADVVAPSCMLDGVVQSVRSALDGAGFADVAIMSYSTKFASALYGPFRDAAESGCRFGDRSTYQVPPGNFREAILESVLDFDEGADILMVKPAGYYLDVLAAVRTLGIPVAAYHVSGEYAMVKAAAARGWIRERDVVIETLTCLKRAGADLIITYYARDVAGWLDEEQ
ncbi:MAG: porphobilinogen synthase [Methanolinea sp.]|nr:porphobilinogen synthase [Methanolinea sp.]